MCDLDIPSSFVILSIILITGCLGGLRNWISEDIDKSSGLRSLAKRMLDGIIASSTVPLFLSVIGNEKISAVFGQIHPFEADYQRSLFILIGFCALAALFSQSFLDSLSNKVMHLDHKLKDVEKQAGQTSVIADLYVEPDVVDIQNPIKPGPKLELSAVEKMVLKSLTSGQFLVRSMTGIASDTGIDNTDLEKALKFLHNLGLARNIETLKGERWVPTEEGRAKSLGDS